MADGTSESDTFISSRMPADNGYGQNGYQGASSDLPGQKTTSGFLPAVTLPKTDGNWQTRKVDAAPIAAHPGMSVRKSPVVMTNYNSRPVKRKA